MNKSSYKHVNDTVLKERQSELFTEVLGYCRSCDTMSQTRVLFMPQGLGNACAACGALRKGKPYISKKTFKLLKLKAAKDSNYESTKE